MSDDTEQRALGRLEGKLDGVIQRVEQFLGLHQELEKRIRELEQWRWKVVGIATAAGAALSWILKKVLG